MTLKSKGLILAAVFAVLAVALIVVVVTLETGGGDRLEAGFDSEFLTRPDGYKGLKEAYDFEFARRPAHLDPGMMYRAVADGSVDVICGFLTDGRIEAYDLKVLEDDESFFPPYDAAPLIRGDTLERYPQLRDILNKLDGKLSTEQMRKLNYQTDREDDPKQPRQVAYDFLIAEGLINANNKGDGSAGRIVVGGKNFTEQDIIGEMMALLIEHHSNIDVGRKLSLGGTMICFNALRNGDLDLYAEYTGTGLVSILDRKAVKSSEEAYAIVSEAFAQRWDLAWLEPFGFNNTYTLTMRKKQAEELGIGTISDLAAHVRGSAE